MDKTVNTIEWSYIYSDMPKKLRTADDNDVRRNVAIHTLLEKKMIEAYLDPAPESITNECAIAVRLKKTDLPRAIEALHSEGHEFFKIV